MPDDYSDSSFQLITYCKAADAADFQFRVRGSQYHHCVITHAQMITVNVSICRSYNHSLEIKNYNCRLFSSSIIPIVSILIIRSPTPDLSYGRNYSS
jgi:hypothetical protein